MDIKERMKTVQADYDALIKRRTNLISQVDRLREELSKLSEEILRCQGSYQILKELEDEQNAPGTEQRSKDG
jgi:predicted nuclease with TOPRIM domain